MFLKRTLSINYFQIIFIMTFSRCRTTRSGHLDYRYASGSARTGRQKNADKRRRV